MKAWLYKHRFLWGYLGIVAVSMLGAYLYQHHTVAELNKHDARSCAQRNKLARNQAAVMRALSGVIAIELDELDGDMHPGHQQELTDQLVDLHQRLKTAGPETC